MVNGEIFCLRQNQHHQGQSQSHQATVEVEWSKQVNAGDEKRKQLQRENYEKTAKWSGNTLKFKNVKNLKVAPPPCNVG